MNRQALAPLIVGVISVASGLWVGLQLRIDRCIDKGGRWFPARRVCELPPGVAPQTIEQTMVDFAVGGLVTLAFAYLLLRMWLAIMKKKQAQAAAQAARQG